MTILAKLLASLFWSVVVGLLAKRKNLNPWAWGIAGAASWFIALVFLAFQPYRCVKCKRAVDRDSLTSDGCRTCVPNVLQGAISGVEAGTTLPHNRSEPSLVQTLLMPLLLIGALAVALYFVYRPSDRSTIAQQPSQTVQASSASHKTGGAETPLANSPKYLDSGTTAKELKPPSTQSLPVMPSVDAGARPTNARSADELEKQIVQIVKLQLKSGATLTISDHAGFWNLMKQLSADEQSQVIKMVKVNLAEGLKVNLALLDSALISANHGKVVKTAEFIEAATESRKVFLTTLPTNLTPMQREVALREYEAKRMIADRNNEEFLRSAAAGRPHKVSEDHFIATDVKSLRSYTTPMRQSVLRLNRLLSPTWQDQASAERHK